MNSKMNAMESFLSKQIDALHKRREETSDRAERARITHILRWINQQINREQSISLLNQIVTTRVHPQDARYKVTHMQCCSIEPQRMQFGLEKGNRQYVAFLLEDGTLTPPLKITHKIITE